MKKITFLLLIIIAMMSNACAQQKKMKLEKMPLEEIKEIWIYNYFPLMGYTTAGAYGEIIRLEEAKSPKFKLEQNDVDSLRRIWQETSPAKSFHTKLASRPVFAEIILENEKKIRAIIAYNVISVEIGKNYWIKNEENEKWLNEFIIRVKNGYYVQ